MPQLEVNRYNCNLRFVIFVVQHCGTCLMQPLLSRLSSFTGVWIEIQLSIESCTDQQMCPTLKSSYQNHRKYLSGTLCTFKEPTTSHHTRTYLLQGWRGAAVFDWSKWQQSDSCLTARRTSVLSGPRPPNSIHSFILIEWHDRERETDREWGSQTGPERIRDNYCVYRFLSDFSVRERKDEGQPSKWYASLHLIKRAAHCSGGAGWEHRSALKKRAASLVPEDFLPHCQWASWTFKWNSFTARFFMLWPTVIGNVWTYFLRNPYGLLKGIKYDTTLEPYWLLLWRKPDQ